MRSAGAWVSWAPLPSESAASHRRVRHTPKGRFTAVIEIYCCHKIPTFRPKFVEKKLLLSLQRQDFQLGQLHHIFLLLMPHIDLWLLIQNTAPFRIPNS